MSIRELEKPENERYRHAFLKAWRNIKEIPDPSSVYSFWTIGGIHGAPFSPRHADPTINNINQWNRTEKNQIETWGGFCQHNNVLFPTWHRFYLFELEKAMIQFSYPEDKPYVALHY